MHAHSLKKHFLLIVFVFTFLMALGAVTSTVTALLSVLVDPASGATLDLAGSAHPTAGKLVFIFNLPLF